MDTSESIGKEYGLSKGTVVRLVRIDKLIDGLKSLVDSGELAIRAGVELSFLSSDTQAVIAEYAEDSKIDMKTAKMLRASANSEGNIDRYTIENILCGGDTESKSKSVKISNDTYTKYFNNGEKPKEITETIEKALALYFKTIETSDSEAISLGILFTAILITSILQILQHLTLQFLNLLEVCIVRAYYPNYHLQNFHTGSCHLHMQS